MSTIVTRSGKGSPLTHAEMDANVTNLNTDKLESTITVDVSIDGDLTFPDDHIIAFGNADDLIIIHSPTDSVIRDTTGHRLWLQTDNNIYLSKVNAAEYYAIFYADAGVELRHNNIKKFETKSSGIEVTGTVIDDGATHDGDVTFNGASSNLVWDKSATTLQFPQNSYLKLGPAYLLHQAVAEDLFIVNPATAGHMHLQVKMANGFTGNCVSALSSTGEVRLHYSDSVKLQTKSTGIDVTGAITADGLTVAGDTDATTILGRAKIASPASDIAYFSHYDFMDADSYSLAQTSAGLTAINAHTGQPINLNINDSNVAQVTSTGIDVTGSTTTDTLRITSTTDASVSSTGHGFQIGPSDGVNIAMDGNEIMARNNGSASDLYLNKDGARVLIGSGGLVFEDTDHKIEKATSTYGHAIRVSTDSGYTDIGMQNGFYSHFVTDSTNGFYFQNGVTMNGNLFFAWNGNIGFEGSSPDANETFLYATDPTADRSIYLPDESGTLATQTHATGKAIAMSIVFG